MIMRGKKMSEKSETWKHTTTVSALVFLAVFISFLPLTSCGVNRNRNDLAGRMAAVEGRAEDDSRIKELEKEIRAVDKQVEDTIESVRKKGTYWRLLGLKYMDYKMWGEASSAFQESIAITPDHALLHYNSGLCYGQLALSASGSGEREELFKRSESSYRRALEIDPRSTPAMYALAVLLVFELNRPLEAAPLLEKFLDIERGDVNGRFLLARVYLEAGRPSDALDLYDEINRIAKNPADKRKAEDLFQQVAGGEYGS
jgi:tetratricopeptide (TPR) repeat protein